MKGLLAYELGLVILLAEPMTVYSNLYTNIKCNCWQLCHKIKINFIVRIRRISMVAHDAIKFI